MSILPKLATKLTKMARMYQKITKNAKQIQNQSQIYKMDKKLSKIGEQIWKLPQFHQNLPRTVSARPRVFSCLSSSSGLVPCHHSSHDTVRIILSTMAMGEDFVMEIHTLGSS